MLLTVVSHEADLLSSPLIFCLTTQQIGGVSALGVELLFFSSLQKIARCKYFIDFNED
jgi:hypothetical protein